MIVAVDAKLESSDAEGTEAAETQIVAEYKKLYSDSSETRLKTAVEKIQRIEKELRELGAGIELIKLKKQNSIGSYFLCKTVDGLQRLNAMFKSGTLKTMLENVFNCLLASEIRTRIENLSTDQDDYDKCRKYLNSMTGINLTLK